MKYIVVLCDGSADWKIKELGNKTCFEAARTPVLDAIAPLSETGVCKTVPNGFKPGSDVANMAVMGFAPEKYYTGRSPLEAASMGIEFAPTDLTVRCNLVTLSEDGKFSDKIMVDYGAGEVTTEEAAVLIDEIKQKLGNEYYRFYAGENYRHCLVVKDKKPENTLIPPHDITGKKIANYLPKGPLGGIYAGFMKQGYDILSKHPINTERKKRGLLPANGIWFWGEGSKPNLPDFYKLRGLKGGVISAVDLVRGIGLCAGMRVIKVENITGNYRTNFKGKAEACVNALLHGGLDYVYVHIDAPDECGHHSDCKNKIYAIERIDEEVIGTIISRLNEAKEPFTMLVCPDHPTPCALKTHTSDPVPFLIYSSGKNLGNGSIRFNETEAYARGNYLESGTMLIEKMLQNK